MILKKYLAPEYYFLLIGFIMGLTFIFINPPWHANDEDRHFYNAYAISEGEIGPVMRNNQVGNIMPRALVERVDGFQGIQFTETNKISKDRLKELEEIEIDRTDTIFKANPTSSAIPFAYIPASIGISFGSIFTSSAIKIGWWARFGTLIAYLFIVFYAIKKMPYFKYLLLLISLSPMALYQASSVTYDALALAFLFLLFSMIISYYYQEKTISKNQIILFILVALAQRLSKDGYFILFFSLFALNIKRFSSKKLYFTALALLLIISFIPTTIWNQYLQWKGVDFSGAKLQSDFLFDSTLNIKLRLQDILGTIRILINNIVSQGSMWISGCIGRFGYSYTLLPEWIAMIYLFAYPLVVVFDCSGKGLNTSFRWIILILSLMSVSAIIFGFLITGSPVGANNIFGLQGRYFLPILPFLLLSLFHTKYFEPEEKIVHWGSYIFCLASLVVTLDFLNDKFYL